MIPSTLCHPLVVGSLQTIGITTSPIDLGNLLHASHNPLAGGLVLFSGDVRNSNQGKEVMHLEYEAEIEMADAMVQQILDNAKVKWNLVTAYCVHRIGLIKTGETAVVVITSHKHRKEAYTANEYIIDRVKHEVPIWKKEVYSDGTYSWGNLCSCH